jgi:hypothetical protein
MNLSKLNEWLQLLASIAVLAGIVLVAWELEQNNELAQAESVRALWSENGDVIRFEMEFGIPSLFRRSIEDPHSLTDDEIIQLAKYLQLVMNHQINVAVMEKRYGLAIGDVDLEAKDLAEEYFGGELARSWFFANEYWLTLWEPEFIAALKEAIETTPVQSVYRPADILRSGISSPDEK